MLRAVRPRTGSTGDCFRRKAACRFVHTYKCGRRCICNRKSYAQEDTSLEALRHATPQAVMPGLRLIQRIGHVDPSSLEGYRASGGYDALRKAVALGAEGVVREVIASKLMGRGGAAFPTGRKWDAVAKAETRPRYVVCNADESEPGTFKDRLLMEGDPFAVVEGMTIAGFATGSAKGYLYIRGEYPLAIKRVQHALDSARSEGWLGANLLDSGFGFDIEIRAGPGRTSVAKRRRCSTPSKASEASRVTSRRSRCKAGCSVSRPRSTMSKRS